MSNIFGNLTNDGLEEAQDRLGGGYQALETDAYPAIITMAYAGQAASGARSVTVHAKINDTDYRETIYITNKKGENFFLNKDDNTKKVPLPGFTTINDICLVGTGAPLCDQATEDKLVKIWDKDERKEVPKSVPVLVDLIGKEVGLGILNSLTDVNEKVGNDYVPTGKTRNENNIEKVYDLGTRMTVVEAVNGMESGVFMDAWVERNKSQVRDKTSKAGGQGAKTGKPGSSNPPQAGNKPATKSLFGNKAA